jgi:hypothetical protein
VLDFVGGGDLFHHLRMHKKFNEDCVRYSVFFEYRGYILANKVNVCQLRIRLS